MIVVTTEDIAGRNITETLGLVRGNTIRARHLGRDIMAGLRTIVGGEIHEYAKLMGEAREQAIDRMVAEAEQLAAEGVQELILISQITTNYGVDLYGKPQLADLLRALVRAEPT